MSALVHHGPSGLAGVSRAEVPVPRVGSGEVLVELHAAAFNHRDLFIVGQRGEDDPVLVLGSDGAGVVSAVGPDVTKVRLGDKVVVNPSLDWARADETPEVPQILGGPRHGTMARYVLVPAENVEPKPVHLNWAEAAALPLAGLTAYRALFTRGHLGAGQHVLLPGIGSGVATLALLVAKAAGAEVSVTSRSEAKRQRAIELGASSALDTGTEWRAQLRRPVDLVVDGVGVAAFESCLSVLRAGGRMVTLGATTGDQVAVSLRRLFFQQISLVGTSMGSAEEFTAMLDFVAAHQLRPIVDHVYPFADAPTALADLEQGDQFGKLVVSF
ncbi:putative zinc-type alcohol dehydrogenase-like protein YogA [Longimycelium tulufanense]|uniref:Putative zinc-type alcohol dehydrogenase-like protein YogA n=2 Tax=Longimycelium tulufanense TaxID=907463 RepID=A0A8J3CCW1_9PSEU|nr:putative zinc-type alcohol dehydrogenase-like protein YogA [Longimycelium tulufanense]